MTPTKNIFGDGADGEVVIDDTVRLTKDEEFSADKLNTILNQGLSPDPQGYKITCVGTMTPTPQPKSRMEECVEKIITEFGIMDCDITLDPVLRVSPRAISIRSHAVLPIKDFLRSSLRSLIETYDRETEVEEAHKDFGGAEQKEGWDDYYRAQSAARAKWKGEN